MHWISQHSPSLPPTWLCNPFMFLSRFWFARGAQALRLQHCIIYLYVLTSVGPNWLCKLTLKLNQILSFNWLAGWLWVSTAAFYIFLHGKRWVILNRERWSSGNVYDAHSGVPGFNSRDSYLGEGFVVLHHEANARSNLAIAGLVACPCKPSDLVARYRRGWFEVVGFVAQQPRVRPIPKSHFPDPIPIPVNIELRALRHWQRLRELKKKLLTNRDSALFSTLVSISEK